jgi:hypothetical protein
MTSLTLELARLVEALTAFLRDPLGVLIGWRVIAAVMVVICIVLILFGAIFPEEANRVVAALVRFVVRHLDGNSA